MLKSLEKSYSTLHIAGREYHIRYSLNALLYLETAYKPVSDILKTDWQNWSIDDVLHLIRAAMCSQPQNFKAVNKRLFDNIKPSLQELGEMLSPADLPVLKLEIVNALVSAFPNPQPDTNEQHKYFSNEGHLRALYVDVMGKNENDFWRSTHKEISDRINYYLETKGLKERPIVVKQFDD